MTSRAAGRVIAAPENHLPLEQLRLQRRNFIRGGVAAARLLSGWERGCTGGEATLVPPWTRSLGAPVVTTGYGMPSKHEANVQRRQSPGLTPQPQASVSFTPLQNLFGIITPSGVHFERHHSGMPEVDPQQHRLMIHGLVKRPLMLTMDDVMRFPSVSRIHFIECGANGGMEWANVAVPTVQYTHGMIACSEFTGVLLSTLLDEAGFDRAKGRFVLAEGRRRLRVDAHDSDGVCAERRDGRLRAERRNAAAGKWVPIATAGARRAGRIERQVAASSRGWR